MYMYIVCVQHGTREQYCNPKILKSRLSQSKVGPRKASGK